MIRMLHVTGLLLRGALCCAVPYCAALLTGRDTASKGAIQALLPARLAIGHGDIKRSTPSDPPAA